MSATDPRPAATESAARDHEALRALLVAAEARRQWLRAGLEPTGPFSRIWLHSLTGGGYVLFGELDRYPQWEPGRWRFTHDAKVTP